VRSSAAEPVEVAALAAVFKVRPALQMVLLLEVAIQAVRAVL